MDNNTNNDGIDFNDFADLVFNNRSYRRFDNSHKISTVTLRALVNLARNTASAANRQPVRYVLTSDEETCAKIFEHLHWAGYLKDWDGPAPQERPTGYITLLTDKSTGNSSATDEGIICQTILLAAGTLGLGGCILGNVDREPLMSVLGIPDKYQIRLVIALGKPVENVILTDIGPDEDYKYHREKDGTHIVPKYNLDDLII